MSECRKNEIKKKISEGLKQYFSSLSDEERKEICGNKMTDESKFKLSESQKKRYDALSDEERDRLIKIKKEVMSRPEIRNKISKGMKGSPKLIGYENPDFKARWGPRYESLYNDIVHLLADDTVFDFNIMKYIKNKYGYGVKLHRVLDYYVYRGYLCIKDIIYRKDLTTTTNVTKKKTLVEIILKEREDD